MASANEPGHPEEFRRRRQTYRKFAIPSVLLFVVAVGLLIVMPAGSRWAAGVLAGIGFAGHILGKRISKYPCCPRCDARIPPGEGWFPKPSKCLRCNLEVGH